MTIELITSDVRDELLDIYNEHKSLTFQNNGYEYIRMDDLTKEDIAAHKRVSNILKDHIVGFVKFNNFRVINDRIQIRLQYNWGAEDNTMSFTGVGYIFLDELYKGFDHE